MPFTFYPGQPDFLARLAITPEVAPGFELGRLITADTGTGKSLMAILLARLKLQADDSTFTGRALLIVPGSTVRGANSQWQGELDRFAPGVPVFPLYSPADLDAVLNVHGTLPAGIYLSYPEALFANGTRGGQPSLAQRIADCGLRIAESPTPCSPLPAPCSPLPAPGWDFVAVDEAHQFAKLGTAITEGLLKVRARWRYAFTATPTPDRVTDLFPLLGWLCVPGWGEGGRQNEHWPWTREALRDFRRRHLVTPGKGGAKPIALNREHELIPRLRAVMATLTKAECNPDWRPADLRVEPVSLGWEQARAYLWLEQSGDALTRRSAMLGLCTDPREASWQHDGPAVTTNWNPKLARAMELIRDCLGPNSKLRTPNSEQTETVLVICSRTGQSDELERRLAAAGIPTARIDSTIPPARHGAEAARFRRGEARVLLMGERCAAAHSFPQTRFLIVASLEDTDGRVTQALGRVDRVNSRPGVIIWLLVTAGTVEEEQLRLIMAKGDTAGQVRGDTTPGHRYGPAPTAPAPANAWAPAHYPREADLEAAWPALRNQLREITLTA